MRLSSNVSLAAVALVLACTAPGPANGQFFNAFQNLFRPVQGFFGGVMRGVNSIFGGQRFTDDGTQSPQATGIDELFPDDCGRDTDKGTGKLCFPDGILCRDSKFFGNCNFQMVSYELVKLNNLLRTLWAILHD